MRLVLALVGVLVLAGCATRLPSTEALSVATADAAATPPKDLEARFVRCETEGMVREYEVERESETKNILAVVLGYTGERGEGGGQTVGLDYVHMFNRYWGVGGYLDFAAGGLKSRVLGAGVSFHPIEPLFIMVGPGIEWVDGESQGLIRVGTGWEFEVGENTLMGPAVFVDFLENGKLAWFVGAQLGYEF